MPPELPRTPEPPIPPTVDMPAESAALFSGPAISPRTPRQQSMGAIISIFIIVAMIVVGAFYAWGQRIAQQRALTEPPAGAPSE